MAVLSSRYAYEGTETTEVAITRVGSPADPTGQMQSRKIVTSANAQWLRPFRAEPYVIWNPTAGASVDVTVYGTVNSGALPLNDELFMEVEYLTLNGGAPLGKLVTTTKANVLATPAAVAADASSWSVPGTTLNGTPSAGIVMSNGNLTATHGTTGNGTGVSSTALLSGGKYYFEYTLTVAPNVLSQTAGILLSGGTFLNMTSGSGVNCTVVTAGGVNAAIYSNNGSTGKVLGPTAVGDVFGFAIDLTSRLAWIRKNAGNWNGDAAANPATGVGGVTIVAGAFAPAVAFSNTDATDAWRANFGATAFVNAAPSGFLSWDTGWTSFKLTTTLNAPQPGLAGYIDVRVRAAKPSTTYYIDPTVVLTPAAGGTTNASTAYKSARYTYEGTETTETSITRVGGAADPTGQAQSRKIVTTANAQWLRPFKAEPYAIWNAVNGISVTVTLCGVVNATALPLNDEIFMEVEYLTLSSQAAPTSFDGSVSANITLSNGNLTLTHPNTNAGSANSASNVSAGKYYFELTSTVSFGSLTSLGLMLPGGSSSMTGSSSTVGVFPTVGASKIYSGAVDTTKDLGAWAVGAVLGVAVDLDARLAWFRKNNGSWNASGTANPATGVGGVTIPPNSSFTPVVGFTNASGSGEVVTGNFGATAYANAAPSGFSNWATPAAPLGKLVTTTKANVLAAPAVVAADGSSWSNTATPPTFTPANLTGLIGWWDAGVPASLTLAGSDILAVADQSGGSNNLVWTAFAKPQYNATGFNSKPAFVFRGQAVGDAFNNTALPLGTDGTLTAWYVGNYAQASAGVDNPSIISYTGAGQPTDFSSPGSFTTYQGYSSPNQSLGKNGASTSALSPINVNHRVIFTIDSGGVAKVWVDGVAGAAGAFTGNWITPGLFYVGRSKSGSAYWAGSVGEVGIAAGYSDAATVAMLDNYLANKWGLGTPFAYTPFKLTTTLSAPPPGMAGYIHVRVRAAKPGAIYYIDPKITLS